MNKKMLILSLIALVTSKVSAIELNQSVITSHKEWIGNNIVSANAPVIPNYKIIKPTLPFQQDTPIETIDTVATLTGGTLSGTAGSSTPVVIAGTTAVDIVNQTGTQNFYNIQTSVCIAELPNSCYTVFDQAILNSPGHTTFTRAPSAGFFFTTAGTYTSVLSVSVNKSFGLGGNSNTYISTTTGQINISS